MFVLRCTRKLIDRVDQTGIAPGVSTTVLGDWFAQPLSIGRRRFILLASERARLPMLVPAREVRRLGTTFPAALAEMLACLEIDPQAVDREIAAMREYAVAATNNRSVLGSLNDYARLAAHLFDRDPDADLFAIALFLSDVPCGPLDYKSPRDVARRLLGGELPLPAPVRAPLRLVPPVQDVAPAKPSQPHKPGRAEGRHFVTDLRHFLDGDSLPADIPGPDLEMAFFFGGIVAWVTSGRGADGGLGTNVPCHRRTGRSPCRGIVDATLSPDSAAVLWHCPVCGDYGETRGWEGTLWDRRAARG